MQTNIKDAPWLSSYGKCKFNLEYPTGTICERVFEKCEQSPTQKQA